LASAATTQEQIQAELQSKIDSQAEQIKAKIKEQQNDSIELKKALKNIEHLEKQVDTYSEDSMHHQMDINLRKDRE